MSGASGAVDDRPEDHLRARKLLAHALITRTGDAEVRARVKVIGGCMRPLLHAGDWIEINACEAPPAGAIVLALDPDDDLVCHRVLERRSESYRLAGDHTLSVQSLPSAAVLGRVVSAERDGRVLRFRERAPAIDRWLARWQLRSVEACEHRSARAIDRGRHLLLSLRAASLWARAVG